MQAAAYRRACKTRMRLDLRRVLLVAELVAGCMRDAQSLTPSWPVLLLHLKLAGVQYVLCLRSSAGILARGFIEYVRFMGIFEKLASVQGLRVFT